MARVRKRPGVMNKLETCFSEYLETQRQEGLIREWAYEPEKLRIAKATTYTPDFRVVDGEGYVIFYEIKGSWRAKGGSTSRVKLKTCAEIHPYKFIAVTPESKKEYGSKWKFEEIN